jgi:hypothetical protein
MRFVYFCVKKLFIKSYFELQKVDLFFINVSLSIGVILGFTMEFFKIGILMLHNVVLIFIDPLLIAL